MFLFLFVVPGTGAADDRSGEGPAILGVSDRDALLELTFVSLRVGVASSLPGSRPNLCGEIAPSTVLSFEACGNGGGFLHREGGGDFAHFRVNASPLQISIDDSLRLAPRVGVGFSELEVGQDDPGFVFGPPAGIANSTSGPEVSSSIEARSESFLGFELIGALTVGVAYFRYAPRLSLPERPVQPFAAAELGVGW
jgi:hypothetical protein